LGNELHIALAGADIWEAGAGTCSLLASCAASFPLRRPSPTAATEMASYLLACSEDMASDLAR
jgi:hypothetical protein